MSIDETTVEAIKSAIASFDEGELNGWELGVLLARAERDAAKLREQEAQIKAADDSWAQCDIKRCELIDQVEILESAIDSQKEAYEAIFRIFTKRLQAAEEAIKLAVYFLDEQEALTHMYYRLKGDCEESELDTFNAKDIEWRNALTAYCAAGKGDV